MVNHRPTDSLREQEMTATTENFRVTNRFYTVSMRNRAVRAHLTISLGEAFMMTTWAAYLADNQDRFLQEFKDFLSIASVSTIPAHAPDVRQAATWVNRRLQAAGFSRVEIMETAGHPLVYGEWLHAPGRPTVLLYGHFDVQPVDPVNLWTTPPFEPTVRDGRIYARGASDMKGSVLTFIVACEALLQSTGSLPLNVKVLIEGEEEIGSPSLESFIIAHKDLLTCDMMISGDSGQADRFPILNYGARGLLGLQIDLQTANTDLHSGGGGMVPNPIHALVRLLDSMRRPDGTIAVTGFYEDVAPLDAAERTRIAAIPDERTTLFEFAQIKASFGEPEYTPEERSVARPTLEINGIWGGFSGDGAKTVIPREAHAKITCRLVPGQTPDGVYQRLIDHIEQNTPDYATVQISKFRGQADPYLMPLDHAGMQVSARVLHDLYGKTPVPVRAGGTVPILGMMLKHLGVYTVSYGFSGDNENVHAPNEHFRLSNFELGQRAYCMFFEELAKAEPAD